MNNDYFYECLCDCGQTTLAYSQQLRKGWKKSCGCLGKKFDHLSYLNKEINGILVEDFVEFRNYKKSRQPTYNCSCLVCGKKIYNLGLWTIRKANNEHCNCKKTRFTFQDKSRFCITKVLHSYKTHANTRNLAFDLTREQFIKLIAKNCYYCNLPPSNITTFKFKTGLHYKFFYSGVDRKDNTLGYNADNSVSCCKHCNRTKSDLTYQEFTEYLNRLTAFQGWKE